MKAYLRTLKQHEGLFSLEKGVVIKDYNGEETSGFFENKNIKNRKLEVIVVSEEEDVVLVKLPGKTFEAPGDKSYLWVKKEDLEYASC